MTRILIALVLCSTLATAQDHSSIQEKIKKQMEEITQLMRESERWLLEMTQVDRVVNTQEEIVEEMKKLLDKEPPNMTPEQRAQRQQQKQQLEQKQTETVRKLDEMLKGQEQSADMTVKQLQELLRNLPRQQQQGQGQGDQKKKKRNKPNPEKQLKEEQKERTQKQPKDPRQKKDDPKHTRGSKERKQDTEQARRRKLIEAWIARLPPEDQARINRNDFSTIPSRYRQLVEEYTTRRAKREAEKETDDG